MHQKELKKAWYKIGSQNYWIAKTDDPVFTEGSIATCQTIESLQKEIGSGNWCLGQGFSFKNLCFINQIDGGDEWLTIKDDYCFESITFGHFIKSGKFIPII
ncbi:hypothetical protein [Pedobacter endophyticus]|uniref:Uncharacterized protein n=1 Tax=Pedobacter endophyticus TaxID=2789740 RepID=A0A7S9L171_9SPHI|nr:hypothetical protein [Pedobacter endophyticus]QPH40615.1 hypothetical protein IZT61_04885 [Pedobacter endophyticus]